MTNLDVILPAGGMLPPDFARVVGTSSKALITLDGNTILKTTLNILKESDRIRRVVVIGPREIENSVSPNDADVVLPALNTGPENIYKGLYWLNKTDTPPEYILVLTADLPFVTKDALHRFLDLCPDDKDICVPLISREDFGETFPNTDATFVALKDGVWTTGCAFVFRVSALQKARPHIERVFEQRKSKMGMARLLGMKFVWKYLTKTITVKDIEKKVHDLIGCEGAAIFNSPAELAFDIDYLEDYHYATQLIQARKRVVVYK
jgi:CTP:molybdopterin cytidylyltransferase MocA